MTKRRFGMPRIPPKTLNCAAYLYPSVADAEAGEDFGGTAFFVMIPSSVPDRGYLYAVTNWHVAVAGGASVLRVNTKDGGTDIFDFGPEDWDFDRRFDIAVVRLSLDPSRHSYSPIPVHGFVSQDDVERVKLGPGDDVFMVGRFVDHDGGPVNRPSVRFGNISVMPTPIPQENGGTADSYCIDLHSRSGYSGSPVFVYRTPGFDLEERLGEGANKALLVAGTNYLALLGIHFAQFPEQWEIRRIEPGRKAYESHVPLLTDGAYVSGLSGMTCVLPAWSIMDVLNMPKLKEAREQSDAELERIARAMGKEVPTAEVAARRDKGLMKALNTPPLPKSSTAKPKKS